MIYEIKSAGSGSITDVDQKTGTVKGYASIFGNKDSDGDIVMPGAFKKSLNESKRQLHLYQHDPYRPLSSVRGGSLKLEEDPKGLNYESTITPTSWGQDVLKLIQDKVLNENSIGYQVVRSQFSKAESKDRARELHEVRLHEISSVSWGANPQALGHGLQLGGWPAKSENKQITEEMLAVRIETATKAFRNGTYTDEAFEQLEIYIRQLNQLVIESKATTPIVQAIAKPVVESDAVKLIKRWNNLIQSAPKVYQTKEQMERIRESKSLAGRRLENFLRPTAQGPNNVTARHH
jgi:uncharacterized protein